MNMILIYGKTQENSINECYILYSFQIVFFETSSSKIKKNWKFRCKSHVRKKTIDWKKFLKE